MRTWIYTWASSDGFRHEGEMQAASKDEVYAELRKQHIRAIKVTERIAPVVRRGFRGLRKRDITLLAIGAVLVAVAALWFSFYTPAGEELREKMTHRDAAELALPRHYVSLPADVEIARCFSDDTAALYLVQYAMPGETVSKRLIGDFIPSDMNRAVVIKDDDGASVRELKRIVIGMKEEARRFLNAANGKVRLAAFLEERQTMERNYRRQTEANVRSGVLKSEEAEEILRAMGLRPLR